MLDFIMKRRILYYLIEFTWGIFLNIIGLIVSIVMLITGHKPHKFGYGWYFKVGDNWGGVEFGICFICGKTDDSEYIKCHESGHSVQNLCWGPLYIFVIGIPSIIRYWYRELKYNRKGKVPPTTYDAIWFEGQATKLGRKYFISYIK